MWSLGCILFELVTGRKAFGTDYAVLTYRLTNGFGVFRQISEEDPSSDSIWALRIPELLAIDPNNRPSATRYKLIIRIAHFIFSSVHEPVTNKHLKRPSMTAFRLAVSISRLDIITCLLNDFTEQPYLISNDAPLREATANRDVDVVMALIKAGIDGSKTLLSLSSGGDDAGIKLLLAAGVSVNTRDDKGRTALMLAASENHIRATKVLLDAGANFWELEREYLARLLLPIGIRGKLDDGVCGEIMSREGLLASNWRICDIGIQRAIPENTPSLRRLSFSHEQVWLTMAATTSKKNL